MSQSRTKIVRRLTSAQLNQEPVTIWRKHLDADRTSGFVIAVLDDWVVLQDLYEAVYLDDVVLLRLDYVTKVEAHQDRAYVSRAVAGLGESLQEFECALDATINDLLGIVAERSDLVCIHLENKKNYWFAIGKILAIGRNRLDLHYIGRDGVWCGFVDAWKLKDITRIEFGGKYLRALERFGDPMPDVKKRVKRQ